MAGLERSIVPALTLVRADKSFHYRDFARADEVKSDDSPKETELPLRNSNIDHVNASTRYGDEADGLADSEHGYEVDEPVALKDDFDPTEHGVSTEVMDADAPSVAMESSSVPPQTSDGVDFPPSLSTPRSKKKKKSLL